LSKGVYAAALSSSRTLAALRESAFFQPLISQLESLMQSPLASQRWPTKKPS
jgi:hypothetical protein